MECWSNGVMERLENGVMGNGETSRPNTPILHYSIIPI